jgi:hypothetical protein
MFQRFPISMTDCMLNKITRYFDTRILTAPSTRPKVASPPVACHVRWLILLNVLTKTENLLTCFSSPAPSRRSPDKFLYVQK